MSLTCHGGFASNARPATPLASQGGVMLIEALVAIIIFSVGILALVGLQAVAMKEVATSKMRSDASYVADRIVGDLSSIDLSNTAANQLANRLGFLAGDYTATAVPAGLAGSPEPADQSRAQSWQDLIGRSLPNGRVTIQVTPRPAPPGEPPRAPYITLIVSWESTSGSVTGPPSPCWVVATDTAPRSCFIQAAAISDD